VPWKNVLAQISTWLVTLIDANVVAIA